MSHLTVVAEITAKPGSIEDVKAELQKLIDPTREENGCINYELHQSIENAATFIFHESWTSEEHLNVHLETAHIKKCQAALTDIIEGVVVHRLRQIG